MAIRDIVRTIKMDRIENTNLGNFISTVTLKNGEIAALGTLEIISIPHISIISGSKDISYVVSEYKKSIQMTLNEIHQFDSNVDSAQDVSLELLWKTKKTENQPYEASIQLFVIVRAIDKSIEKAKTSVDKGISIIESCLLNLKYEVKKANKGEISEVIRTINDASIKAIVKEERIDNLQNQIIPYCYSFGRIQKSTGELSELVAILAHYPDSALSVQLMPYRYNSVEAAEIDRVMQGLDILSKGVSSQGGGTISFSLAGQQVEDYKYYAEHKKSALFSYNVIVYGSADAADRISGKVASLLKTNASLTLNAKSLVLSKEEVRKDKNFYPLPWAINEVLVNRDRNQRIWGTRAVSQALYKLPYVITSEEASELFSLPIGSDSVSQGLRINEAKKTSKTFSEGVINSGDVTVGFLKSASRENTIGLSCNDLTKHMLIVGTPGSGKTTFSIGLLEQVWEKHKIPFLVIEPAKNEYRALIDSIPDLQIFTPGKTHISPFVFNPFLPPKNVHLETYKSTLKTAFAAGVTMATPLDKIFEEAISNCYSDFKWLDIYTSEDRGEVFNIDDFVKCFRETFEAVGYLGDANNIGKAGVVRLNSFRKLFDSYFSIPIEDLLCKPTVIELAAIENSDEKSLIIALVLLSILSYANANYDANGQLRNILLLEEAHVLFGAEANSTEGAANPSVIAQNLIKRMLAEIRSYGIGMIIADQSPKKVTTDVVALTDIKLAFRLVEHVDKQIIADSSNMDEQQEHRIGRLRPGEAFLFFGRLDEPEEIITPNYREEHNISVTLSDHYIANMSTYWIGKQKQLRPYPQCDYCSCCSEKCDYQRRVLARDIARRIFVRNINTNSSDPEQVRRVFRSITAFTMAELNGESFSHELLLCVKLHLWRKLRYDSKIPIKEIQIINSLKK